MQDKEKSEKTIKSLTDEKIELNEKVEVSVKFERNGEYFT